MTIAKLLAEEHAELVITDPKALSNAAKDLADIPRVTLESDPYKAAEKADAILLITEWDCYKTLNWEKIYTQMRQPALLFDTRNILDHAALKQIGFNLLAVGKTFA